jgi:hypothetical protein
VSRPPPRHRPKTRRNVFVVSHGFSVLPKIVLKVCDPSAKLGRIRLADDHHPVLAEALDHQRIGVGHEVLDKIGDPNVVASP